MFNYVEIKFSWVSIHGNLWSIIVSHGQTAFFLFSAIPKKNGKKRSGHARLEALYV